MLSFSDHVFEICKEAAKQLAVLIRLGSLLTKQGKLTIFNSFILSNFNYCPIAWHFCGQIGTRKMERIRERTLRFINNAYSSPLRDLLAAGDRSFLHIGRLKVMAGEVFKILNKIFPEC